MSSNLFLCVKDNRVFLSHNNIFNPGLKAVFLAFIKNIIPQGNHSTHLKVNPNSTDKGLQFFVEKRVSCFPSWG